MASTSNPSHKRSLMGAAFLMATSAIGPGFLTQTTFFTGQLLASFGFVILVSIVFDIIAQLNIWRTLTVSGMRAQDLSNRLLPGSGYALSALIVFGGFAFNIGNIAGAGLGLHALTGIPVEAGAVCSACMALLIFWFKEAGRALDRITGLLGLLMVALTCYVCLRAAPPLGEAAYRSIVPAQTSALAIITLIGGTVGGYISFAGAHRLIDAGYTGTSHLPAVNKSAVTGILVTGLMRILPFLATWGVLAQGFTLPAENPAAGVFRFAAGETGYRFFGLVMWCAAITSVMGASYTSVSFVKTFHPFLQRHERPAIIFFILVSTSVFMVAGRPVNLLVAAGAINGFILPLALALLLVAATRSYLVGRFRTPLWLYIPGWMVVAAMLLLAVRSVMG